MGQIPSQQIAQGNLGSAEQIDNCNSSLLPPAISPSLKCPHFTSEDDEVQKGWKLHQWQCQDNHRARSQPILLISGESLHWSGKQESWLRIQLLWLLTGCSLQFRGQSLGPLGQKPTQHKTRPPGRDMGNGLCVPGPSRKQCTSGCPGVKSSQTPETLLFKDLNSPTHPPPAKNPPSQSHP